MDGGLKGQSSGPVSPAFPRPELWLTWGGHVTGVGGCPSWERSWRPSSGALEVFGGPTQVGPPGRPCSWTPSQTPRRRPPLPPPPASQRCAWRERGLDGGQPVSAETPDQREQPGTARGGRKSAAEADSPKAGGGETNRRDSGRCAAPRSLARLPAITCHVPRSPVSDNKEQRQAPPLPR